MYTPRTDRTKEIEEHIRRYPYESNVTVAERYGVTRQWVDYIRHRIGQYIPARGYSVRVCNTRLIAEERVHGNDELAGHDGHGA